MPKMKTKSGAKKRFSHDRDRQSESRASGQAARHDQADEEIHPRRTRHHPACPSRMPVSSRPTCPITGKESGTCHALNPALVTHARHRKVIKAAAGYYGARSRNFRTATAGCGQGETSIATRDRKNRKRNFRALWIQRINAAVRAIDPSLT